MYRIFATNSANFKFRAVVISMVLVSLGLNGTRAEEPKEIGTLKTEYRNQEFECLSFSPDGKSIATSVSHLVQIWDFPTLARRADFKNVSPANTFEVKHHIYCIAFSPDSKLLAASGVLGRIGVWNLRTGKEQTPMDHNPPAIESEVYGLAFTPDGKSLVSLVVNGAIRVWEVGTGKEQRNLGKQPGFGVLAVSPDGKTLAVGGYGPTRLFELSTGKVSRTFGSADDDYTSLAFAPHGKTLAWARAHKTTRLLNVGSGKETLIVNEEGPLKMAFSPNGTVLATISKSGAKLWDVVAGKQLMTIQLSRTPHPLVAFSPDSKVLATKGDDETTIKLWDVAKYTQQSP
jgi:WD40 repeat protein